jgi:hypothetical protein
MTSHMHKPTIGGFRLSSDLRQLAGLLMVLGICALVYPQVKIASAIGPNGTTPDKGISFSDLFGSLCMALIGFTMLIVGYMQLIHDHGHKKLTSIASVIAILFFIPFFTDLVAIGRAAKTGRAFIAATLLPSRSEVRFVGAMGILAVMAYGLGLFFSIIFVLDTMTAYLSGKAHSRGRSNYRNTQAFFCSLAFLAGLTQFILGIYCAAHFGRRKYVDSVVAVAVYVIHFPAMSIVTGLLQMLMALWGLARSRGFGTRTVEGARGDHTFQIAVWTFFVLQVLFQVMVQIGYGMGEFLASAAPAITAICVPLVLMPAYLDWKGQQMPEIVSADYYGGEAASDHDHDHDDENNNGGQRVTTVTQVTHVQETNVNDTV